MDQISIYDLIYEKYKITKPIRLIELFAGYGSQALALKYLGVDFTHWHICEWATKSIQAYNDLHIRDYKDYSKALTQNEVIDKLVNYGVSMNYNEPMTYDQIKRKGEKWQRQTYNNIIATHNLVSISTAKAKDLNITDTDKYEYILTYSFPCQDLSLAGKQKGMSKDSNTRSSMLWQVERLLDESQELPQILLMENVPQVISKKNMGDFELWLNKLEQLGYTNYCKVLNAKDYCIPQNRQRCFMVSILKGYGFNFPKTKHLKLRLKDLLDAQVDEKYYLSEKMIKYLTSENSKGFNRKERFLQSVEMTNIKGIATTINTNAGQRPVDNFVITETVNRLYGIFDTDKSKHQAGSVYDVNGIAPTLDTMQGGWRQPCIEIKEATKKGYTEAHDGDSINLERPNSKTRRGRVGKEVANTLLTICQQGVVTNDLKIRKLTPKECWRLMGVKDNDFNNVAPNQSNSSLYHLAGDSIVTTPLMAMFGELLGIDWQSKVKELVNEMIENKGDIAA